MSAVQTSTTDYEAADREVAARLREEFSWARRDERRRRAAGKPRRRTAAEHEHSRKLKAAAEAANAERARKAELKARAERADHARRAEAIRKEWLRPDGRKAEAVRLACNRLRAEGRPINPVTLRACGCRGSEDELFDLAQELAARGLIDPGHYNSSRGGRRTLIAAAEPDPAVAIGRHVADYDHAWRRIRAGKGEGEKTREDA